MTVDKISDTDLGREEEEDFCTCYANLSSSKAKKNIRVITKTELIRQQTKH